MAVKILFLEEFGKAFVPKRAIPYLREYLIKAGITAVPYAFFGGLFWLSALITLLLYVPFVWPYISNRFSNLFAIFASAFIGWFTIQIFFAFFFILTVYFYVDLKIYTRTREMEELLPDFLQVLSSNLRGGMSFERALWASIKPRFNVLANEMAEASKKAITGYDVEDALTEFSRKYDSSDLKRSVDLIAGELESGGNVAHLIDKIVDNLKKTRTLKEDMAASAITYVIFIGVIVIVIAPALFALSFNLLMVIIGFAAKLSTATTGLSSLPMNFSDVSINPTDFKIFSAASLTVIAIFSSMIVSIVEKGNIKSGIKYIPLFTIGSLLFYFAFMKLLSSVFAGFF